ncbi:BLUF domain-containing protein [Phaeobacter sp. PT47_59]|uniref:BLUF domain-containing protein n=1 Tax=Phaeobacter sp. PT47_59 TaxID=3029979 RepID=UPI00238007E1|nr:BLUF domain-containing protein [Phaeobacter sp. PT47_59]MDE4173918.1 BLUF domain-containing protein [Phaeobacter sp. PT47_59]
MHRIVYFSHMARKMTAREVAGIVGLSRTNNARDGLTGLLLYHGSCFFQVLEGGADKLALRYQKIAEDPRHANLRVVQSEAAEFRAFPDWRMGLLTPEQLPVLARDSVFSLRELFPMNSEARGDDVTVRRLVRDFLASFQSIQAA